MKKTVMSLSLLALFSCSRSMTEVWDDTKVAGNYLQKGWRSFWGSKDMVDQYASSEDFFPSFEEEFVALEETPVAVPLEPPQSKFSPGERESPIPGITGFVKPVAELSSVFRTVHFDLNAFKIRNQQEQKILDDIAKYLKKNTNVYVFLEGHTDERGTAQYNLALGAKRANTVRAYLIKKGVELDRIFTISYGLERPKVKGHKEEAWNQNRRVEFKIFER